MHSNDNCLHHNNKTKVDIKKHNFGSERERESQSLLITSRHGVCLTWERAEASLTETIGDTIGCRALATFSYHLMYGKDEQPPIDRSTAISHNI